MNQFQLQVKAGLVYLSLMFPDIERRRILSILLPEMKADLIVSPDLTIDFLSNNGRNILDDYKDIFSESPNGDLLPEQAVIFLIDTLFNHKNGIDNVERSCLFATVLTLCAAFRKAFDNDELGCTLQQAYNVYSKVVGTPQIEFTSLDDKVYGSYVGVDCLNEDAPTYSMEGIIPLSTIEVTIPCRKFPKFKAMSADHPIEYMQELYSRLSNEEECFLFKSSECSRENFLALFEGVPGYEDVKPHPFRAAASFDYWGVFLSVLYPGRSGFKLTDGTIIMRGPNDRRPPGLSISEFAMNLIKDQTGHSSINPKSFDRGKGGGKSLNSSEERNSLESRYKDILSDVNNSVFRPSESHKKLLQKLQSKYKKV